MASARTGGNAPGSAGRPPAGKEGRISRLRRLRPRRWWPILTLILVVNWILVSSLFPEPSPLSVPYTTFKEQVQAGNVEDVVSQGDTIQATLKRADVLDPALLRPGRFDRRVIVQRPDRAGRPS